MAREEFLQLIQISVKEAEQYVQDRNIHTVQRNLQHLVNMDAMQSAHTVEVTESAMLIPTDVYIFQMPKRHALREYIT